MKRKNRFITGYAGLRALAVIGVILYHLNPNRFMGGYLGVPIFLVLSGYLVTDHMFHAYEERGKYDFKSFYVRRIKKLYPQMIALLWGCSAYILLFQQNLLAKLNQMFIIFGKSRMVRVISSVLLPMNLPSFIYGQCQLKGSFILFGH